MPCRFFLLPAFLFLMFGCQSTNNQTNAKPTGKKPENVTVVKATPEVAPPEENKTPQKKTDSLDHSNCDKLKRDDLSLDKKQTFAIDFKPFEKSCFVTFHDPEFDDPPLRSEFYIYQDGKEVFSFPEQFNGGNTTCWVSAAAFEDVNNDQLPDIIVIGKCGAKADAYHENMVYLNTGRDFVTNVKSNSEMMDFKKISQISNFVKKNPTMFSK